MSRDINRILNPGEEVSIQATGDYIYCKAATVPVHVALDMQVVEMVAGDKLREPSRFKSFKLENRSPDTVAYVTFVVGEGDYMRQIVQGELAVQPKLLTENGTLREDSRYWLSLFIRPEPGYTPQTYTFGETVKSYPDREIDPLGGETAEYDEVNRVWAFRTRYGDWIEYDADFQFIRQESGPGFSDPSQAKFTFDRSTSNNFIFWQDYNRAVYYGGRYGDAEDAKKVMAETPSGGAFDVQQGDIAMQDGKVYYQDPHDAVVYSTPVEALKAAAPEWSQVLAPQYAGNDFAMSGKWVVINFSGETQLYDKSADNPSSIVASTLSGPTADSVTDIAYKGGLLYSFNDPKIDAVWGGPGPDTISVQAAAEPLECRRPAGMIDTAGWRFTLADISTKAGLMGEIEASGEIIGAALALYGETARPPDDYLDHVYAVKINTGIGRSKQAVRANQTFAAAGLADDFRMTIPGAIHIQIDALLFDN